MTNQAVKKTTEKKSKIQNPDRAINKKGKADHIDELVGKRLKMRRMLLGLSQQELGEAVDVSIQQVQKYEKAKNRIPSGRLFNFSRYLKVSVEYFFNQAQENGVIENALLEEVEEYHHGDLKGHNVSEKEVVSLIRAFGDVKNPLTRKKIVELVRSMA